MSNNYSDRLAEALKEARPRLVSTHRLEFTNVFGAIAGYVNGKIFISCGNFGLALRLPQKTLEVLFKERGVKLFKYFPKGYIKQEYAVIPKRIMGNGHLLKKLVDNSIRFVSEL